MSEPDFEHPNWAPLALMTGATCTPVECTDPSCPMEPWMWMYRKDGFEFYKHRETRDYIQLPSEWGSVLV